MAWNIYVYILLATIVKLHTAQRCSWTSYSDSNSYGGSQQSSVTTQVQCQNNCLLTSGCLACEWVNSAIPGSQCFFFTTSAPPTNIGSAPGVVHYIWSCIAGCSWTPYSNSNSYGGIQQSSATTDVQCQLLCSYSSNCLAYEWASQASPGQQCFLFATAAAPTNIGSATGVNHYTLACTATSPATVPPSSGPASSLATTISPSGSGCYWNLTSDTNSPGGSVASNITSLDQCKNLCVLASQCAYGLDWNPQAATGQQCWISKTNSLGSYIGIAHWNYVCSGGCSWTAYNNSNSYGGVPQSSVSSQSTCQSNCMASSACLAYEWVNSASSGSQCYFFNSSSPPTNIGTATGVVHYIYSCATTATTPVMSTAPVVPGCNWNAYNNSNSYGGTQQSSITSSASCQSQCFNDPTCLAYEWVASANPGSQCFTFQSAAPPANIGTAPGVVHYVWFCATSATTMAATTMAATTMAATTAAIVEPTSAGCSWTLYNNSNSYGGMQQSNVTSRFQCRIQCLFKVNCSAYEWVNSASAGLQCFLFTSSAPPANIGSSTGVEHYTWNCITPTTSLQPTFPPGCNWTQYNNSNSYGGAQQTNVTSQAQCQSNCLSSATCLSYEWVANAGPGSQCFFFNSSAAPSNIGTAQGVVHFVLTCTQPTTLAPVTVPGCSWTAYNNSNSYGGAQQNNVSSQSQCQNQCFYTAACTAYEWVNGASPGSQCFFFTSSAPPANNGSAQGVVHYTWNCLSSVATTPTPMMVTPTGVPGCNWTSYNNSNSYGGALQSNASTQIQCLVNCFNSQTCLAYEWVSGASSGQQCFVFTSSAPPTNIGSAPGVVHYTWTCVSATTLPPSTTASALNTATYPAGCAWTLYQNSNTLGGVQQTNVSSQALCQVQCYNSDECYAYEWVVSASSCYFFTSSAPPTNIGSAPGVMHYIWNCTTTTIASIGTTNSGCYWNQTANSNSPGGAVQTTATTFALCQSMCLASSSCMQYGFDWNAQVVVGQQCWFAVSSNLGVYNGVTHYKYICSSANCWTSTADKNSPNGTKQTNATTLDQCRSTCLSINSCKYGLDWNPSVAVGQQCWTSTSNSTLSSYPGVTHWTYTC